MNLLIPYPTITQHHCTPTPRSIRCQLCEKHLLLLVILIIVLYSDIARNFVHVVRSMEGAQERRQSHTVTFGIFYHHFLGARPHLSAWSGKHDMQGHFPNTFPALEEPKRTERAAQGQLSQLSAFAWDRLRGGPVWQQCRDEEWYHTGKKRNCVVRARVAAAADGRCSRNDCCAAFMILTRARLLGRIAKDTRPFS